MTIRDKTLGCMLIGVLLNCFLLGFSSMQAYLYSVRFRSDPLAIKLMVVFLFALDIADSGNLINVMWDYLIRHFGDAAYSNTASHSFAAVPVLEGVVSFICQSFFCYRVYLYHPSRLILIPIMVFAAISFLCSVGVGIAVVKLEFFDKFSRANPITIPWLACGVVADILIAVSLTHAFRHARMGFSHSDSVLNGLRRLSLQTGLLTMTATLIALILYSIPATGLAYLVFQFPSSKLYSNSLLSVLLNRQIDPLTMNEELNLNQVSQHTNSQNQNSKPNNKRSVKDSFKFQLGMLRPNTQVQIIEEQQQIEEEISGNGHEDQDFPNLKSGKGGKKSTQLNFDENVNNLDRSVKEMVSDDDSIVSQSPAFERKSSVASTLQPRSSDSNDAKSDSYY